MKLYYYKNACSLAVRIIINELSLSVEYESLVELQVRDKKTQSGEDFYKINPKNQIPVLILEDGRILTECVVIMQYLAELRANETLTQSKSFNKYRVLEWLNYEASELHKNFVPIISPIVPLEAKGVFTKLFMSRLKFVNKSLEGRDFLVSDCFTIADAYMFVILSWLRLISVNTSEFGNLERYLDNLKTRASIAKSLTEEGIVL